MESLISSITQYLKPKSKISFESIKDEIISSIKKTENKEELYSTFIDFLTGDFGNLNTQNEVEEKLINIFSCGFKVPSSRNKDFTELLYSRYMYTFLKFLINENIVTLKGNEKYMGLFCYRKDEKSEEFLNYVLY